MSAKRSQQTRRDVVSSLTRVLPDDDDYYISFKAANKWLATVKTADYEKRLGERLSIILPTVWTEAESPWPGVDGIAHLKGSCARHRMYELRFSNIYEFSSMIFFQGVQPIIGRGVYASGTRNVLVVTTELEQLSHLVEHYGIVGGDRAVIHAARPLQGQLFTPLQCLEKVQNLPPDGAW